MTKLQIAFFYMEGKALSWYSWLIESSSVQSWDDFVSALEVRFGPSAYEDPVGKFTKRKHDDSVEAYQSQFEMLSNKISSISREFRISTFFSGLRDDLRIIVTMFKPSTLSAAFGLARLQEEEVLRHVKSNTNKSPTNPNTNSNYQPKLLALAHILRLPAPPNKPNLRPQPFNNPRKSNFSLKRAIPIQMQERKEIGLSWFCDEKYRPGYKCNKPRIYLLDGIEGQEEENEETKNKEGTLAVIGSNQKKVGKLLGISLHAIAGSSAPKTRRLFAEINHQKVMILIDIGSTHSFIDPNVARKANLPREASLLTVQVTSGAILPCLSYCKAVSLKLQDCIYMAYLYVLTLGGCDLVLDVDWLRRLGSNLWNFADLTMRF